MDQTKRSHLVVGLLLIALGAWFLAVRLLPGFERWASTFFDWPAVVIFAGLVLLVIGALTGSPGMAVPAAVVAGIGGLLVWQNATGNWSSWAYAWALIPGFAGVGTILAGLMGGNFRRGLHAGAWQVLISLVLFFIFSSFLGGQQTFGPYWPVLVILLGVILLAQSVIRR
jgi:hypothetical protein